MRIWNTLLIFGIFLILCLNLAAAEVEIGNKSHSIEKVYGPAQQIRGWINISLNKEAADSLLSGFASSTTLFEFLEENHASFSCFPTDCESYYITDGTGDNTKIFVSNAGETKLLGASLGGNITRVNSIEFDITADGGGNSCAHPIMIDILDDGIIEWRAEEVYDDFDCFLKDPYGCYKESDYEGENFLITDNLVCEKINLNTSAKHFKIGAEIIKSAGTGSENVEFKMEITAGIDFEECSVTTNTGGEISCVVEFDESISEIVQADVCISTSSSDNGKYEIKYEDVDPCGYVDSQEYDFPIFVKPGKYVRMDHVKFNQDLVDDIDLESTLSGYISDRYNGNCDPACIIPIKIYVGLTQEINITNLKLIYNIGRLERNIYYVKENKSLISSDFQKLELSKANILSPTSLGSKELVLKLGNNEILRQDISIEPVPGIRDILPHNPSALVPVTFIVLLEESGANLTYHWDFGDGSRETTDTNTVKHSYSEIDSYDLTVSVSNKFGNSTKTVKVNVVSPKKAINETLIQYKEDLKNVERQIDILPEWIKERISEKINLSSLESEIKIHEEDYEEGFIDDDKAVSIMKKLLELKVPYALNTSLKINPSNFFQSEEQVDLDALESLGAGKVNITRDEFSKAVNSWLMGNLEVSFESSTYAFYFRDGDEEPVISHVKITFDPKQETDKFYFVVNGDASEIKFKEDLSEEAVGAVGITIPGLSEKRTVEFLYPSQIEFPELPFYISPEFKNLDIGITVTCNKNKICEEDLGEDYKNCRPDCKPVLKTLSFLFILFLIAFVIYIVLQEWYKRRYESHLFPNKTQLFNLVNFINNSLNQGLKRSTVFSKLKEQRWSNEQVAYVWNKYHGKRTGMWEIPIFKWVEKRRVRKEIAKRQGAVILSPKRV